MQNRVVLDEFVLTLTIPANCPDAEVRAIRKRLSRGGLRPKLRQLLRDLLREYAELKRVKLAISQ